MDPSPSLVRERFPARVPLRIPVEGGLHGRQVVKGSVRIAQAAEPIIDEERPKHRQDKECPGAQSRSSPGDGRLRPVCGETRPSQGHERHGRGKLEPHGRKPARHRAQRPGHDYVPSPTPARQGSRERKDQKHSHHAGRKQPLDKVIVAVEVHPEDGVPAFLEEHALPQRHPIDGKVDGEKVAIAPPAAADQGNGRITDRRDDGDVDQALPG